MVDAGEIKTTVTNETLTHPDTTTETDLIEYTSSIDLKSQIQLYVGLKNLTQTTTITVYYKTDGTTYDQGPTKEYPTDYDTNQTVVPIILDMAGQDTKITLTSGTAEGAVRDIYVNRRRTVP